MRKRHRPQREQTEASLNKDKKQEPSQASRSWCSSLFYFIFFSWILLLAFSQALSFSTGIFSWHFPRFSGVQADRSSGHQKEQESCIIEHAQEKKVLNFPVNESASQARKSSRTNEPLSHWMPRKDFTCRPLLKEVLFCSALSMCCPTQKCLQTHKGADYQHPGTGSSLTLGFSGTHDGSFLPEADEKLQQNAESRESYQNCDDQGKEHRHFKEATRIGETLDIKEEKSEGLHQEQGLGRVGNGKEQSISNQVEDVMHVTSKESSISKDSNGNEMLPVHDIAAPDTAESTTAPPIVSNETHPALTNLTKIHLRHEPGDGPYNYASESKGAKILASNKEAKGASNILNKDKDKYFRTPCNVETKFVDMELSEETLVVEITIANHEFYSSNVKEFELWGSSTYPTEEWILLGKFEPENSRVSQTFALREPKWVRYLKIKMLSHYGADFYCTMSVVEVYGVDAIEWLLEEWIAEESGARVHHPKLSQEESSNDVDKVVSSSPMHSRAESDSDLDSDVDLMFAEKPENASVEKGGEHSEAKGKNPDITSPVFHMSGRPALDAVMKLLMQKVRSLEHSRPIISQNVEQLDERYKELSRTSSKELTTMKEKLEGAVTEIANLRALLEFMEVKWHEENLRLETDVENKLKAWDADLGFLRNELRRSENKESVALALSLLSIITAAIVRLSMLCTSSLKGGKPKNRSWLSSCSRMLWAVPYLSCFFVAFVLSL